MPKIVDKAEMRAKILKAGMDTFIKYGFNHSSMARIAKEAGMAKGTVYLYYDSKESLSLCILNDHFDRMGRQLLQEAELDSLDDFKQHLLKILNVSDERNNFMPILFQAFGPYLSTEPYASNLSEIFEKLGVLYASQIEFLQKVGKANKRVDAALYGRALASMMDGMMLHRGLFNLPKKKYRNMTEAFIDVQMTGLRP